MSLKENEILIKSLEAEKSRIEDTSSKYYEQLNLEINRVQKEAYANLSAWDRVYLARHTDRPKAIDYLERLFDHFYELKGDRLYRDDEAIIGGIASFKGIPVTIIAQAKGKTLEENIRRNFGMVHPEGYRKVLRLAKQAEKFKRPIITFVDTAGAYPGKGAEERGQAQAIADCLYTFSNLKTPVIAIVLSEGGSGGALALSIADKIIMLENAVYSILSPEGFASILWKDDSRVQEAAEIMKLTAYDLADKKIVDHIVSEPVGGAQACIELVINQLDRLLSDELENLMKKKERNLLEERYQKFRQIGAL